MQEYLTPVWTYLGEDQLVSVSGQHSFSVDVCTCHTHSRIPGLILATVMHAMIIKAPTTKPWPHDSKMMSSVVAVSRQSFVLRTMRGVRLIAVIESGAKAGIALTLIEA